MFFYKVHYMVKGAELPLSRIRALPVKVKKQGIAPASAEQRHELMCIR